MLVAKRKNREYQIDQAQTAEYVAAGFDIYNQDGKLIEHGAGKTVPYAAHMAALDRIKELEVELRKLKGEEKTQDTKPDLDDLNKEQLLELAKSLGLEVDGKATSAQLIKMIKPVY